MTDPADIVDRFNATWNDHDLDAAIALTSPDCVFESTSPAPDGERFVGPEELRRAWAPIFASSQATFTVEDSIAGDGNVVQRWRYDWGDGHVRGVDVITVADGLITAKLSYVKG